MPRYSSFGQLDDQLIDDADLGFVNMNNRLRPDQLKAGVLADSQNGRMGINGEWQTRKGIDLVKAPVTSGTNAVTLPVYLPFTLNDTAVNAIYGSCLFSNPNDLTSAYIILASNNKALAINLADSSATPVDITYPNGETISSNVSMLQAFNKVFIFREGNEAFEWNGTLTGSPAFTLVPSGDYTQPSLITSTANTIILNGKATVTATAHGLVTGDAITVIDGKDIIANDTVVVVAGRDTDSFYYYITENHATTPAVISGAIKGSQGLVTITTSADHGYATDEYVKISNLTYTGSANPNGTWKITKTSPTEFTYVIASQNQTFTVGTNSTAVYAASMQYMQKQSVGLGFCYMPAPPWAVYHQRRLWMPFYYTQSGTSGSATFTSRGIKDELIVSDILDSNTYDQVYNEYRFNAGSSDYIVALHPFAEDKLVVFNRNSIHLIVSSADIAQSSIQLITNEVGCLARKTLIQVADNILFLSDNGIYGANFPNLYNLRGNGVPLSDGIQATINRINKDYVQNAVAAYYDNRYYIAVPLDSSITNNAILVYNFLNQGWESIDTVSDTNWEVTDLYVGGYGSKRGLYAVNKNGGIHRLDSNENGRDIVITQIVNQNPTPSNLAITSSCTTRMFTYGVTDRKKFNNFELQLQSSAGNNSDVTITAEGENVDGTMNLGSVSSRLGEVLTPDEDASIRGRIGQNRSYGLQFTFTPTTGRPRIRTIKVSASITNRALTSVK
jgi:hypothetical protein